MNEYYGIEMESLTYKGYRVRIGKKYATMQDMFKALFQFRENEKTHYVLTKAAHEKNYTRLYWSYRPIHLHEDKNIL